MCWGVHDRSLRQGQPVDLRLSYRHDNSALCEVLLAFAFWRQVVPVGPDSRQTIENRTDFGAKDFSGRGKLSCIGRYIRQMFAHNVTMEIGGFNKEPDWVKLGPSLVIASSLVLAIRTAKWSRNTVSTASQIEWQEEVEHSIAIARSVIALTILAEFLFNIYMFHLFLDSVFSPLALVATVLWALTFMRNREVFRMILNTRLDRNSQWRND
jgi:hypothetical protein